MNILGTGAKGIVGTALVNNLKNIRDGKNRTRPNLHINNTYCYNLDSTPTQLDAYYTDCDFVFNLAGVNHPQNNDEFMQGNFGFSGDAHRPLRAKRLRQIQACQGIAVLPVR